MPKPTSILLLGGDKSEASRLRRALARHFLLVEVAEDFDEARELTQRCLFHVLALVDPELPWARLRAACDAGDGLPSAKLLIVGTSQVESAIAALRDGVADVLLRPFSTQELVNALNDLDQRQTLPPQSAAQRVRPTLVGDTPRMQELKELVRRIGPNGSPVLIEGEAGTGKELFARLLHEHSGNRGRFVAVDCGAGQFREELFAAAEHGTLFLNGVSELGFAQQDQLLRALATPRDAARRADEAPGPCRIVAASRFSLTDMLTQERFRDDLYLWLGAPPIVIPPLRERRDDVSALVSYFMKRLSEETALPPAALDHAELETLKMHDWPGNVAELRAVVEATLFLGRLPPDALAGRAGHPRLPEYPHDWTLEQVKKHHMARVLEASGGNKSAAARRLGVSRKTLERKLGKKQS